MFLNRTIIVFFILLCTASYAHAQIIDVEDDEPIQERLGSSILDDTTKQIYGPTTSQYTYEYNVKYNAPHYWSIDTSIIDLHKYQFDVQKERLYTNLGNIGTPANSIFPILPQVIGVNSGFNLFDVYYRGPDEIRYYDTKSPYSRFKIIWGGQGRAVTEVNYGRSIDERSGFGFDYRGLFIDKQIQRNGRGDRNAKGTYYTLFGHYATKDGKYRVLGNFIRNNQIINEYGGILIEPDAPIAAYFDEDRQLSLTRAMNNELRTNYHIYQQYRINKQIQIYHEYNRYKQQNDFIDDLDLASTYFDFIEVDSADVKDRSKIVYRQHEVGLKGDIGPTFYSFYYKYKSIDNTFKYLDPDTVSSVEGKVSESYGGFYIRVGDDSVAYAQAYGEFLQGGNYKLGGSIQNSWLYARGVTMRYEPAYVYQAYRGSHDVWINDFEPPQLTQIEAGIQVKLGTITFKPAASSTLISKPVYFTKLAVGEGEQSVLPVQASSDVTILSPSLGIKVDFLKHFTFQTTVISTNVSGSSAEAVNIPDLYARGQLAYGKISFDGNLEWRLGLDAYWKSSYFANGFDPAIMQFYVQNEFEVESFPLVDIFVDAKINRGKLFLKLNNVYEIFSETGYFATPEYPGQTTIFDFGFEWAFYD